MGYPLYGRSHRSLVSKICLALLALACVGFATHRSLAQMGGSDGAGMPAFDDPSFREKLYEAGGFAEREGRQGAVILSVTIEGNQSISESFILSQMQSREDRAFDKETFNRDISALYRTTLFRRVDPYFTSTPEGVHIRLIISEKPIRRGLPEETRWPDQRRSTRSDHPELGQVAPDRTLSRQRDEPDRYSDSKRLAAL
jgi:hypothetical protein